jgi:hypothetical protein
MNVAAKSKHLTPCADEPLPRTSHQWHLLFDKVIDPSCATPRDRFEAFTRAVMDKLSQRWIRTTRT